MKWPLLPKPCWLVEYILNGERKIKRFTKEASARAYVIEIADQPVSGVTLSCEQWQLIKECIWSENGCPPQAGDDEC